MEEKIAIHQNTINELKQILDRIYKSESEEIRFRIETKHWYGFSEPHLGKERHKIEVTKETAIMIINAAIDNEKEQINRFIDLEIENRKKTKKSSSKE